MSLSLKKPRGIFKKRPRVWDTDQLYETGPVSRFGDTAANAGILALLQSNSYLKDMPVLVKTIFASVW